MQPTNSNSMRIVNPKIFPIDLAPLVPAIEMAESLPVSIRRGFNVEGSDSYRVRCVLVEGIVSRVLNAFEKDWEHGGLAPVYPYSRAVHDLRSGAPVAGPFGWVSYRDHHELAVAVLKDQLTVCQEEEEREEALRAIAVIVAGKSWLDPTPLALSAAIGLREAEAVDLFE